MDHSMFHNVMFVIQMKKGYYSAKEFAGAPRFLVD